jgi:hypothetical protein
MPRRRCCSGRPESPGQLYSGIRCDSRGDGILRGVSVNAGVGLSVSQLTAANSQTGYPGILNNQVGVTTVGAIRAQGGEVDSSPTKANPYHATLSGLTPEQASALFRPTVPKPARRQP